MKSKRTKRIYDSLPPRGLLFDLCPGDIVVPEEEKGWSVVDNEQWIVVAHITSDNLFRTWDFSVIDDISFFSDVILWVIFMTSAHSFIVVSLDKVNDHEFVENCYEIEGGIPRQFSSIDCDENGLVGASPPLKKCSKTVQSHP